MFDLPLWTNDGLRQLVWFFPTYGKSWNSCSKPPSRFRRLTLKSRFFLQRKRFENESLLSPYLFSRVMQSWWMAIAELMAVPSCRHINAYQLLLLSEDDPPSTMCVSHDIAYHDIKTWVHGWIWYNLMIRATITKVKPHPHDKKKESGLCYPAGPTVPRPRPFEVCN